MTEKETRNVFAEKSHNIWYLPLCLPKKRAFSFGHMLRLSSGFPGTLRHVRPHDRLRSLSQWHFVLLKKTPQKNVVRYQDLQFPMLALEERTSRHA